MSDLSALLPATEKNRATNVEVWFPPEYSRSEPKQLQQRQAACKSFIFGPLRTHDITDHEDPVKPVPQLEYLEHFIDAQLREPELVVPKVRRMIQTLTTEGRMLWNAYERPLQRLVIINQSLEDGERHVEQDIKNIMAAHLPADITDQYKVAEAKGQFHLVEKKIKGQWKPWDSWIKSFPATARQLRGEGASGIFWDEFSTHPNTRASLTAIRPVLFGRTKRRNWLMIMGTVNPDTSGGRHFMELYGRDNFRRARATARYGVEFTDGEAA